MSTSLGSYGLVIKWKSPSGWDLKGLRMTRLEWPERFEAVDGAGVEIEGMSCPDDDVSPGMLTMIDDGSLGNH